MQRVLTAVAALLLWPALAWGAVAVTDTPGSQCANSASSVTITGYTVTSGTLLIVGVGLTEGSQVISSVTYNGVAMTQLATVSLGSGEARSDFWYLLNPATGSHDVVATPDTPTNICAMAVSISGNHTSTPFSHSVTNTGNNVTPTSTVTSASGELVIDVMAGRLCDGNNSTPGAGQTERVDTGLAGCVGMSTEAGAGSVTMDWTINNSTSWASISASIQPPGGAGPTTRNLMLMGVGK